ncbi:penicillin-binding protein [Stutzerimonas stutzeri]|uniref:Penicillin-binding protein n=1 Tax=Stutzerimonas stutzeri TaxID=316 RepID=A0A2N8T8Z9_STUST|nr:DUF4124 domain-containing protein [Stutzerimonas stutzeri]MCQ4325127.1 DUF4124 domain-containing protein [Stutzerimonas stutzeri]PNG11237.1 penicillin-binding protein [Stutzerimonas stutzeri]
MSRWLAAALLVIALPTAAQVYTYIDAEGNRVFTDRPAGQAAEQVRLKPGNSMPAPPIPTRQAAKPEPVEAEVVVAYQLHILSPVADETIRDNAGTVSVTFQSEPALQPGHAYQLLLDEQPLGTPASQSPIVLSNVDRGTHRLAMAVVDEQARILQRTASQPFHLIRTSLAQRRMAKPCQKGDYGVRPECPLKDKPPEKRDIPFVPFL